MLLAYLCCKIQLIYLDFMPVVSLYSNWKSIYQPSNFAYPQLHFVQTYVDILFC